MGKGITQYPYLGNLLKHLPTLPSLPWVNLIKVPRVNWVTLGKPVLGAVDKWVYPLGDTTTIDFKK